ncbi:hypothetical protein TraAM80_00413 [Trypanosoma rangeli]|uniref:Uncharacterized protein n=1 Tax=Trypanosoma rangeli TaxID=5698 RepID=A0A422P3M7_TRYRA|nr:uncharacterized protein TraAM80_00413 [Trypanosoma rangeli]RNF12265.1 hypothetical protein TraAM80_00413 [Trypanosoma rangeli]|eukprot:RNF12265.1 hypothetical protein TraAM80_00413 [Trypanosoma rangeli]
MREEDAIVSLGAVCISLYQCQPLTSSRSRCLYGTAKDYRGDVLVPFYKGCLTYRELAEGVEYRLNQYFVVHPSAAPQQKFAKMSTRKAVPHAFNGGGGVCKSNTPGSGCSFNGSYVCSRCDGSDDAGRAANTQTSQGIFEEFPRIVVRNFTRERDANPEEKNVIYEAVDDASEVTEDNICCFFYYVKEKCTKTTTPTLLKDGSIKRPLIGRDHVRSYASDNAFTHGGKVQQHIELKVGERLLRIGTSAEQKFEDIFQRLKRRNLQVHRLFDGVTGASILPCELVRHLSWKVSALCAEVTLPDSTSAGMKRRRTGEEECPEDYLRSRMRDRKEDEDEVQTWISLSEVPTGAYDGSTLCLTSGSLSGSAYTNVKDSEDRRSWQYEQLLRKATFGFDEDEDTVPLVDVLPPALHDNFAASAEAVEGSTPLRSFYLDDDSYMSSTLTGTVNDAARSSVAFTTPLRLENEISIQGSGDGLSLRRRTVRSGCGAYSPIMVTQQSLPDFLLENSDDNNEDEDEYDDNN